MNADVFPDSEGMAWTDLDGGLEVYGKFLDSVDTDDGERLRWAELCLYKVIDTDESHDASLPDADENKDMYGHPIWVLHTKGHTLVYHRTGPCKGGIVVRACDFPQHAEDVDELVGCERCDPPDWQSLGEEKLRLEVTWYTSVICQTADKLIDALQRKPLCTACHKEERYHPHPGCQQYRKPLPELSAPGRNLIERVRYSEPDIDRAANRKKRL